MQTLSSKIGELSFDENGMIASLTGPCGYDFVKEPGLWRIIYQRGKEQEIELLATDVYCSEIYIENDRAFITHESEQVIVRMEAWFENNTMMFSAELSCKGDILIREFQFPYFNLGQLVDFSLIRSTQGGALFKNLPEAFSYFHSNYMAQENRAVVMNECYPGEASANCFCIFKPGHGLYLGSHDCSFQYTLHHLRSSDDGIRASLVKYPFLKKGGSFKLEGFVLAPFNGDWHEAANIYRHWANRWFRAPQLPEWIRDFNGWQRLIMRHQYGQTFFRYADLAKMLADGKSSGIDSLLLFGWWDEGMDAGYPNYVADNEQGGFAALKENVAEIHKKGGKVILYFNGQLIDRDSEFYKHSGQSIAVRKERGNEHTETYNFSGEGTSLQQFGNRVFSTACFSCDEWIEVLKKCIDSAIDLGVDCIFFDQFGNKLMPCFSSSHGHAVPDMRGFDTKAKVVEELHAYIERRAPGLAFGTEMTSDRLASHVDFFHTVNSGYGDCLKGGEAFLEWFRFMFPEVLVSDREIRDDKSDFKRRVNHALQMGLKSDVEIFRCRATIAAAPKYAEYLAKANMLRQEVKSFIFSGRFLDDTPLSVSDPAIRAKAFQNGDRLLVLATHRGNSTCSGVISVPGYHYENSTGLGKFVVNDRQHKQKLGLPVDAIAALFYRRAINQSEKLE